MSDIIRISEQGKRQLIGLKRTTKIEQWNIICRWALCTSLQDQTVLREADLGPMSNVEMTWETFCGPYQPLLYALVRQRVQEVPEEEPKFDDVIGLCTAHRHRGIKTLIHQKPQIQDLVNTSATSPS